MMFVQYPSLSEEEKYHYMSPVDLGACCVPPDLSNITQTQFNKFSIKTQPYGTQLTLHTENEQFYFDAQTGKQIVDSTSSSRLAYANQIADHVGAGPTVSLGTVEINQWSLIPSVARHAPFDVFELNDKQAHQLYFSIETGELIQQVSFVERTWGWVGPVIHWIYPTIIRTHTQLWVQLIIWLSIISLFMVVLGAILGISRLRHRGNWRKSPYRGRFLWHHYTSLFTGILMLTWLFSGLMSMYPWGLMEGRSFADEIKNLRGSGLSFSPQVHSIFKEFDQRELPRNTVELQGIAIAGHLNLLAVNSNGDRTLLDRILLEEPSSRRFPSASTLATDMRPNHQVKSVELITEGDSYYYSHHKTRQFPVYRIIYEDGERIYLDALSMDVAAVFDGGRKTARWLYLGLHRGDFFPSLNKTIVWYLSWGGLLLAMTFAVGVGCWLCIRCWQRLLFKKRKTQIKAQSRFVAS